MKPTKEQIIALLDRWIRQRPGLEYGNYGDWKSYRAEVRSIAKDLQHARTLLRAVECSIMTAEELTQAFRAYSGRLSLEERAPDVFALSYCTGQYWPTEYRRAACAVLACALWDHYRECFAASAKLGESAGDAIRRNFRHEFGRAIAARWFN